MPFVELSFAEYRLFYRTLLQKKPVILRSLLIIATPHLSLLSLSHVPRVCVRAGARVCVCVLCARTCLHVRVRVRVHVSVRVRVRMYESCPT